MKTSSKVTGHLYARRLLTLALIVVAGFAYRAEAVPIDPLDDPHRGVRFDFQHRIEQSMKEGWQYDGASHVLFYQSLGPFEYQSGDLFSGFNGILTIQVRVAADGRLIDHGAVSLLGDLGGTTRLLAAGTVRDIGFAQRVPCYEEVPSCGIAGFRAVLDNQFLDAAMAPMGPRMGLFFELADFFPEPSPFAHSFQCGFAPGDLCDHFSTSGIVAIRVPEPSLAVSLTLAIGCLLLCQRRRALRAPRIGK